MPMSLRTIAMAAGAIGAAGGVVTLPMLLHPDRQSETHARAGYDVCLKSDLVFFADAPARCYDTAGVLALADQPVLDSRGTPASVEMAHPTDATIAPVECRTCTQYREARFDARYAESARDMRREAYFVRACGVLAALADAQPADQSFFKGGSPTGEDVAGLAGQMSFGEEGLQTLHVESDAGHGWRITVGAATFAMQELANADFDNDGVEEILAYFTGGLAGGTAAYYDIGYLEKDAADAPLTFTPLDLASGGSGAAGG